MNQTKELKLLRVDLNNIVLRIHAAKRDLENLIDLPLADLIHGEHLEERYGKKE